MGMLDSVKETYIYSNCNTQTNTIKTVLEKFNALPQVSRLEDYIGQIKLLEKMLDILNAVTFDLNAADLKQLLECKLDSIQREYEKEEYDINTKYEGLLDNKIRSIEEEARGINQQKRNELDESNKVYLQLEEKRKQLEAYADDIIEICRANGITTADVDIDNSSFTVNELNSVYDQYLNFIQSKVEKVNVIRVLRSKVQNVYMQVLIVAITILASLVVKPLWDVGALLILAVMVRNQVILKKKIKSYIVLYGLVFNIRPMEMGFKGELSAEDIVAESVDEDNDSRLDALTEEWQTALSEHDCKNPETVFEEERLKLAGSLNEIQREFDETKENFRITRNTVIKKVETELERIKEEYEDKKSKIVLLGKAVSKSGVLDTKFVLGCRDEVFEEVMEIGLRNIIIKPSKEFDLHKRFLQVLLANVLTHVQAGNINVIVCDPNRQGQELISFYHTDLEQVIRFSDKSLDEILKELRAFAESNLKAMRGQDITSFNKEAEETGKMPRDYRLLIVLSQPKKIEEDEALGEFMKFSANLGVLVWLVSNKDVADTKVFNVPFEGVQNPYPINMNVFGPSISRMLAEEIKKGSGGGLAWKDYIKRTVKDSEIWTYVGDDSVELRPGFLEGDPTQYKGYAFGNQGDVHVIGVGGTGAGKSVFLNFLICETTLRYDPRSYELWLVDYKGNEFSKYLPSEGHPEVLPHIKACLCTSDGDYAGSLFRALAKICEVRFNMFTELGLKNLKQYNEKVRAKASVAINEGEREEELNKLMPRILCINDEFQVIFQKAEQKIIEQLSEDITYISKLGRAAGVHLFFTSQSMTGTLKADTFDQFTLRFALRCAESVSQQILGCNLASQIRQQNGYLYAKCLADKKVEQIKRYRTPYLCDEGPDEKHPDRVDELRAHIDRMAALAKERKYKQKEIIAYQESTKHYACDMEAFYSKVVDIPDNFFLLGERMTYSTNKVPENAILTCMNNMHIFSSFEESKDLVDFYKTIKFNIDKQQKADIIINSQVADLHYLCELDKDVEESKQFLSNEKTTPKQLLKDFFEKILNGRKEQKMKETPLYIILIGWDKAIGFGVDRDSGVTGPFTVFLQTCGEFNIHVIFICSGTGQIPASLVEACRYRIAGKSSENDSLKLLETKQASKSYEGLKSGYMFINRDRVISRAKIYQFEVERKIQSTEFIL